MSSRKKPIKFSFRKKKILLLNPSSEALMILSENIIKQKFIVKVLDTNIDGLTTITKYLRSEIFDLVILDEIYEKIYCDELLAQINKLNVEKRKVLDFSDFVEINFKKVYILKRQNQWHISKGIVNLRTNLTMEFFKRVIDLFIVFLFTPIAFSLVLIGGIIVKLTSKGPVFFKQIRVGKNGKHFLIYKLRTMRHSKVGNAGFTTENDNRITFAGNLLRKSKIDELPQFYNVLKGDMSLIGPRPEIVEIVNNLDSENPYYELRHLVRPGITGWAQVNNPKATPNDSWQKLEYDLFYVKYSSVLLDIKILLKTISIVLRRDSL
jgi:lipopolysaccharide/colanic/teichoic acid biosynthesis glycosyltransferase